MSPHDESDDARSGLGLDGFRNVPDDQGMSLEHLSESFARLLNEGADPYQQPEPDWPSATTPDEPDAGSIDPQEAAPDDVAPADDGCPITPRSIVEAILFVGHPENQPLTSEQIASLMRGVVPAEVDDLVRDLNAAYAAENTPYVIESAGAGYQLALRPQFDSLREKFYGRMRDARLSQSAIDVLAIVAYHQPIVREHVDRLRGKPSGAILSQLVRRKLLKIDRGEDRPRVAVYSTTDRFLGLFQLDAIDELPRSEDLE